MKKFILLPLFTAYLLNAAESNHRILKDIQNCGEIAWLSDGTILVNAQGDKDKLTSTIFSINTKNDYKQKPLYSFQRDENNGDLCLITLNQDKTIAFISVPNTPLIYENNNIKENKLITSTWRPLVLSTDNIIFINKNSFDIYDGKGLKPDEELNTVLKDMKKRPFPQSCHELIKSPNNDDTYLLVGQPEIFQWNKQTKDLEIISLRDLAILPIDMPISPYDLQYHSNGTHIALTYDVPYNCYIYNLTTKKLLLLQYTKANENVEKLRKQYETNPTGENGHLLINAAWNAQYRIDSKAFHPTLPVIATLAKNKGILKYWNINTGQKITKQQLPYQTGFDPVGCMPRLLAFSPNGKQIACALNQAVVIVDVPEQEIRNKIG